MKRRDLLCWSIGTAAMAAPLATQAQTVTTAPVRITSTLPAGSGPDAVARMVAEKLQTRWKQPVLVDAKPGGAGVVAINSMKNLSPTGNELVMVDVGNLSINPLVFKNLRYDPEKELAPVVLLYKTSFFIAVAADGKFKSVKDIVAAAKQRTVTYGSNAVGGPFHLASAQLESELGVDMTHVAYKETSQLYTAVATGEIDWAFGSIATTGPLVKAGKLRLLAVADRNRSPVLPDVPTLEESGGPKGVEAASWVALMAPAGTPAAVAAEINRGVNDALAQQDVREKMAAFGFTTQAGSPQLVADMMRNDRARYAEVIRRLKVTLD